MRLGTEPGTKKQNIAADAKASQVYAVLEKAGVVEDKHGVVKGLITRHLTGEKPFTECIVDNPISANWRLKPTRNGELRLAYYGFNSERETLAEEVSDQLRALWANAKA